jgi:hypothetical protein
VKVATPTPSICRSHSRLAVLFGQSYLLWKSLYRSNLSARTETPTPTVCDHASCAKSFETKRSYESVTSMPLNLQSHALTLTANTFVQCIRNDTSAKSLGARLWPSAFGLRADMRRHYRDVHLKEKTWFCSDSTCGKSFSRKHNLARHTERVHNGDK